MPLCNATAPSVLCDSAYRRTRSDSSQRSATIQPHGVRIRVSSNCSLFTFGAFSEASDLAPIRFLNPVIARATQIRGAEGTGSCGGGYGLGVGLLDLDHGLGAGATIYDHGGFLWVRDVRTLSMVRRTWNIDAVRAARQVQLDEKHLCAERNDSGWEQGCRRCNLP